jgi:hypothetical protein
VARVHHHDARRATARPRRRRAPRPPARAPPGRCPARLQGETDLAPVVGGLTFQLPAFAVSATAMRTPLREQSPATRPAAATAPAAPSVRASVSGAVRRDASQPWRSPGEGRGIDRRREGQRRRSARWPPTVSVCSTGSQSTSSPAPARARRSEPNGSHTSPSTWTASARAGGSAGALDVAAVHRHGAAAAGAHVTQPIRIPEARGAGRSAPRRPS